MHSSCGTHLAVFTPPRPLRQLTPSSPRRCRRLPKPRRAFLAYLCERGELAGQEYERTGHHMGAGSRYAIGIGIGCAVTGIRSLVAVDAVDAVSSMSCCRGGVLLECWRGVSSVSTVVPDPIRTVCFVVVRCMLCLRDAWSLLAACRVDAVYSGPQKPLQSGPGSVKVHALDVDVTATHGAVKSTAAQVSELALQRRGCLVRDQ